MEKKTLRRTSNRMRSPNLQSSENRMRVAFGFRVWRGTFGFRVWRGTFDSRIPNQTSSTCGVENPDELVLAFSQSNWKAQPNWQAQTNSSLHSPRPTGKPRRIPNARLSILYVSPHPGTVSGAKINHRVSGQLTAESKRILEAGSYARCGYFACFIR